MGRERQETLKQKTLAPTNGWGLGRCIHSLEMVFGRLDNKRVLRGTEKWS